MLATKAVHEILPHGHFVGRYVTQSTHSLTKEGRQVSIYLANQKSRDHFQRRSLQSYGTVKAPKVPASCQKKRKATIGEQITLISPPPIEVSARNGRVEKLSLTDWCPRKSQNLLQPSSHYDLASTRPTALELPKSRSPKGDDSSDSGDGFMDVLKHYFKTAKAYYKFYKSGLKSIWSNYSQYRKIFKRAQTFDRIHWTTPRHELIPKMKAAFETGQITRKEYTLYLRTRRDLRKLLPFLLIFIVCGEFSPLVLLPLGPRVIPFPCLLPKQVIQQCQADHFVDRVVLKVGRDGSERKLPTVPSHQTWKAFRPQLLHIDATTSWDPTADRERCIGMNWYKPQSSSVERPLADALLILWEGGVNTLDDAEVLMKAWSFHDPYLTGIWQRAYLASQGRNMERENFPLTDHVDGWVNLKNVDLSRLRQELQLSLEDLVAHLDFYFKTGLDYDPSQPGEPQKRVFITGKTKT